MKELRIETPFCFLPFNGSMGFTLIFIKGVENSVGNYFLRNKKI